MVLRRLLLHSLPPRMGRCRAYGFWAARAKGKDLAEIRRQLGEPPVPVDAADGDGQEQPNESDENGDELMRPLCTQCGERTMEVVAQVPKPTVHEMMELKIWPEQFADDAGDLDGAEDPQLVLPGVAAYLPGGDLYLEALGFL